MVLVKMLIMCIPRSYFLWRNENSIYLDISFFLEHYDSLILILLYTADYAAKGWAYLRASQDQKQDSFSFSLRLSGRGGDVLHKPSYSNHSVK